VNFILGTIKLRDCLHILGRLLRGKDIVDGAHIKEYETRFAQYTGTRYAFSFGAGRMAFYAILKAVGIKEGDEVILPGYTCVVVPDAVVYCGAEPVYVDIDPRTLTIDTAKIEEKVTPRTKAILAQHLFAYFSDMEAISRIANKYNLRVIEDCAQALGASYNGKKAGNFGNAAFFTMEQSKIITTWMGGMATTNDEHLANKLREVQENTEFLDKKATKKIVWQIVFHYFLGHPSLIFIGRYFLWVLTKLGLLNLNITSDEMAGKKPGEYPVRLSNIQAEIGLRQLGSIEANLEHRRKTAEVYGETLKELGIGVNKCDGYSPAHLRYAFLVKDRHKLGEIFQKNQIELGEWYNSVIHPKGSSLESLHYEKGSCPVAEFMTEHCANLPTHLNVGKKDASRIVRLLRLQANLLLNFEK